MFCYQCQETAKNTGCTVRGVCGKNEEVANLQDLLIYTLKGISDIIIKGDIDIKEHDKINFKVLSGLFTTITNANFDDDSIENQIRELLTKRDELRESVSVEGLHDAATFAIDSRESMLEKAASVGILATENEDIRSLREMIIYGLKGMAAY
ncbi:MAG: hydroxylamine reductase, partial [Natronincolaceae bacterium]